MIPTPSFINSRRSEYAPFDGAPSLQPEDRLRSGQRSTRRENEDMATQPEKLTADTIAALAANVRTLMRVSAMTHEELQQSTGIARSTLRRIRESNSRRSDLATLCRLASALGVSPALLLMRAQDWHAFLYACNSFRLAVDALAKMGPVLDGRDVDASAQLGVDIFQKLMPPLKDPATQEEQGVRDELAEAAGEAPRHENPILAKQRRARHEARYQERRRSALAATAIAQRAADMANEDEQASLTCLGALVGGSSRI